MVSVVMSTCSHVTPTSSGTASTAMTRGRSLAGRLRKNLRTPSAESVVVRIAVGWQSSRTACSRPTCPGSAGSNSGHRDAARVQRAEERDHVVQVLRAEDGDPIARLGDLLQAGGDGTVADAELRPVQVAGDAVTLGGEVDEAVGELVAADLGPLLDVTDHASVVGKPELTVL